MHEALLVEGAVLAERTVYDTTQASAEDGGVQGAGKMALVEKRCNFVCVEPKSKFITRPPAGPQKVMQYLKYRVMCTYLPS